MHDFCTNYKGQNIVNKKKLKRNMLRKARIAKEIVVKLDDLSDYRMFFVGLEEDTSSGEEKKLIQKYRKDFGDKEDVLRCLMIN